LQLLQFKDRARKLGNFFAQRALGSTSIKEASVFVDAIRMVHVDFLAFLVKPFEVRAG